MRKCSLTSSLILFKRGQKINLRLGVAAELSRVYYIFLPATAALSSKATRLPCHHRLSYLTYLPKIRARAQGGAIFPCTAKNQPAENWSLKKAHTPTCSYARVPPQSFNLVLAWRARSAILGSALYGGLNFYYVSVII